VEVLVTEGRVTVAAPAAEAALVDAGQHLAVAPRAQAVALPEAAISARLAWRSPRLEFSATPLAEVVALLNRHHRARFVLDDPALAAVPLSGVFRADETEALVRMLEQGFRIEVRREADGTLRLRRR
jgi:transmembrane sensor